MNDKTGSIVNDDGKENAAAMRNNGKIDFATFWKMELQFYGKMICNFLEKCLAKNIHCILKSILQYIRFFNNLHHAIP